MTYIELGCGPIRQIKKEHARKTEHLVWPFFISAFTCEAGEYLNINTQRCAKCPPGTVSVGDSKLYSNFRKLPEEFETYGHAVSKKEFCKKYEFFFRSESNFKLGSVKTTSINKGLITKRIRQVRNLFD